MAAHAAEARVKQMKPQPLLPLSVAAVGCGRVFGRFHLPALRTLAGWSVVALIDPRPERRRWAEKELPGVLTLDALASLPDRLIPDAVLITTSPDSHFGVAQEALLRGAHVLIEKPMVLQPSEAASLVALAHSVRRQIRVGFNRRFRPAYTALRELLAATPREQMRSATFELCSNPRDWQPISGYPRLLDDIASHQLDLLPWLFDRPVSQVRAKYAEQNAKATVMSIDLLFADGLEASCRTGHQERFVERLEVVLDGRRLLAGPAGLHSSGSTSTGLARRYFGARALARAVARKISGRPSDTADTFRRQFVAWECALRTGHEAGGQAMGADGEAGARSVALVEACRRSVALEGAWVEPAMVGVEATGIGAHE
jgi:predicted dehydrogenase